MTHLLWKYYVEDDVDRFRALLAPGAAIPARGSALASAAAASSSPGHGTSPRVATKSRKSQAGTLGKQEINSRDHAGLTILLRAASSTSENAVAFVEALLEHPAIDIYVQDPESGWNALHRALYAGNISIARLLLDKERRDLTTHGASLNRVGQLIKTKDHEGNSPFDLYHSTIGERSLRELEERDRNDDESDSDDADASSDKGLNTSENPGWLAGEDLYAFGSNKNLSLGFADQDDRQFPERVHIQRPDHLLHRFHQSYLERVGEDVPATQDLAKIPTLVRNKPLLIRDVVLSKLHSAVLTADPVSNLYVCGVGRGGRLGLGDENTRFTYTPVQGPLADKRIVQVALGQNHTMAVDSNGCLWTWGSNAQSQLGYTLPPPPTKDQDPISTVPRQVFGPLKKEIIIGVAASAIHSVAHTATSLYCWGKNVGQLALMDADSRSLEFQQTPRKVAASLFSSPIVMATAIDKATTVLLQNHTVCVFTAYGYHIVKFPFATMDLVGNIKPSARHDPTWNQISYITSGGETIAALTKRGDLFTMSLDHKTETNPPTASTTNPSKIKGAVTQPQCIWHARKDGVRSVGVAENGSVIISTHSGAVWRRIKRSKAKDASSGPSESKRKDYKFQRVPGISRIAAVRASAYGTFAAIRKDPDIMKEQLEVQPQSLWSDVAPLNCLRGFTASEPRYEEDEVWTFWRDEKFGARLNSIAYEVLKSSDVEEDLAKHLGSWALRHEPLDVSVCTSSSLNVKIPVHSWLLSARSPILRGALAKFRKTGSYEHEAFRITSDRDDRRALVCFPGLDLVSVLNLVLFLYEDAVIPVWNFTGHAKPLAHRYRHIRQEVMRLATRLSMSCLEAAARLMVDPKKSMDADFQAAIKDKRFFVDGDALLVLEGGTEVPVHTALLCQRCPWFQGLFFGRSRGMWLASRRAAAADTDKLKIDLDHASPNAFGYVLQYLYGDCGTEMFDSAVCESLEDFMDLVMEVMSIADYLMLDRLSQICQRVMGRFANIRNIAHLLNAISPCAVREFKDVGLEYVCLQLETMLENHLLDELDGHLLRELDEVVRDNQAAQSPFVRSGRAEEELHERYPWLAEVIDEERHIRIKEMAFKAQREEEKKLASSASARTKYGSVDDANSPLTPNTPDKARKASRTVLRIEAPPSPVLRSKASQNELIFNMDEEVVSPGASPTLARSRKPETTGAEPDHAGPSSLGSSWKSTGKRVRINLWATSPSASLENTSAHTPTKPPVTATSPEASTPAKPSSGPVWGTAALQTAKLDLRDIIQSEAANNRTSALTAGLAAAAQQPGPSAPKQQKLSQKEKKRQQQAAAMAALAAKEQAAAAPKKAWEEGQGVSNPWKTVSKSKAASGGNGSANDGLLAPPAPAAGSGPSPSTTSATIPIHRRTASPDTRFSGQPRTTPAPATTANKPQPPKPAAGTTSSSSSSSTPLVPHSRVYIPPPPRLDPTAGLVRMEDIMGQETRAKQAVAEAQAAARKRSLQEIQEEQAFQEWWDAESRRIQEEEERRLERERAREREKERAAKARGGGRGRGRGKGGRGGAGGGVNENSADGEGTAAGSAGNGAGNGSAGGGNGGGKRGQAPGGGGGGAGGSNSRRGGRGGGGSGRGGAGGNASGSNHATAAAATDFVSSARNIAPQGTQDGSGSRGGRGGAKGGSGRGGQNARGRRGGGGQNVSTQAMASAAAATGV